MDAELPDLKQRLAPLALAVVIILSVMLGLAMMPVASAVTSQVLYGCDNGGAGSAASILYNIDVTTGTATPIGLLTDITDSLPITGCSNLAFFDGVLYTASVRLGGGNDQFLYSIDVTTGDATQIGLLGNLASIRMFDLTTDSAGAMYGDTGRYCNGPTGSGSRPQLCAIDKSTAAENYIGLMDPINQCCSGNAMDFDSTDTLYHINGDGSFFSTMEIHTIDATTATATLFNSGGLDASVTAICSSNNGPINAMDFDSGNVLYASLNCGYGGGTGHLITIDLSSATATDIGSFGTGTTMDGLAFEAGSGGGGGAVSSPVPPSPMTSPLAVLSGVFLVIGSGIIMLDHNPKQRRWGFALFAIGLFGLLFALGYLTA